MKYSGFTLFVEKLDYQNRKKKFYINARIILPETVIRNNTAALKIFNTIILLKYAFTLISWVEFKL